MKKRLLAALMAGAMALSMTACGGSSSGSDDSNAASGGDSAKAGSYKVGVVQLVQHVALDAATQGFQDKLTELVEADGGKVEFDVQNASGESANCSTIVNGFVSANDDLIMANATAALQAAQAATSDIPILGTSVTDYATALDISDWTGTVGNNISGTAMATYSGQNLGAARMDRVRKGVTSALLIATVYSIASALILHFADVAVMSLFLDTTTEVEIVAMGREYLFWNSVFFVPLGALIVWRYSIQGLGFSTLAMMAGVAEMIARTAVAIVLVPMLGYFGAELANPAAWIAACIFLYPAYRWTCHQLDNRLLAARLHIQSESPEHEAAL